MGQEVEPTRVGGHLVVYARQQHEHLYRMVNTMDPIIKLTDDEGENERNGWEGREATALLDTLTDGIAKTVDLLKDLPDISWGRPGQHPEDGRRSIRQHNIAQVELLRP